MELNQTNQTYVPNLSVLLFNSAPRFGHSDDITQLFSQNKEDQLDYVYGVIFISAILLAALLFWIINLVTFMCLGSSKVGFLSGSRFHIEEYEQTDLYNGKKGSRLCCRSPTRKCPPFIRVIFVTFALAILVCCSFLVTKGSDHLDNTVVSFQSSVENLTDLAFESETIAIGLGRVGSDAVDVRDDAVEYLKEFCPGVDIEKKFGISRDDIDDTIDALDELSDFIVDQSFTLEQQTDKIKDTLHSVDNLLDSLVTHKGNALYLVLPIAFLTSLMIAGTLLASSSFTNQKIECILRRILLPILFLTTIVFYILAVASGFASVVNSDVCLGGDIEPGSPTGTAFRAMDTLGITEKNEDIYEIVDYYITGCSNENPLDFLYDFETELEEAQVILAEFLDTIDYVGTNAFAEECGESIDEEIQVIRDIADMLDGLKVQLDAIFELVDCPRIYDIYVQAVEEGACDNLPSAMGWIFSMSLMIAFCGLVMITLRSSFLETEYWANIDNDDDDEDMKDQIISIPTAPTKQDDGSFDESTPEKVYQVEHALISPSYKNLSPLKPPQAIQDNYSTDSQPTISSTENVHVVSELKKDNKAGNALVEKESTSITSESSEISKPMSSVTNEENKGGE